MPTWRTYLNFYIRLNILAFLWGLGSLQTIAQAQGSTDEDTRFHQLDTAFEQVLETWHAAGFAVAVVEKNKVIYAKGFGYRDFNRKLPVTPNTLFAIASCTKAFTAALTGRLQHDGKVDIDKPVTAYLPSLKFYSNAMNSTITLRDMMSHHTGLPRYDLSWYFFNTPSTDSLIQRIQYMQPTYGVREKWQYNNFMFAAQGAIVQHLTGKSWAENIKQSFFVPLGMTRSNTTIGEMEKSDDAATGYDLIKDTVIRKLDYYVNFEGMAPAGAINSSVNDMSKWVIAWINNGRYDGREIIPARFRNEAISSQSIIDGALPSGSKPDLYFSNYGFGWNLASYKGHYRVEHGGDIDGFSASTCFFPADSIGMVVLCNQDDSALPSIVRNLIADKLLKLRYEDWNAELKKVVDQNKQQGNQAEKEKTGITNKRNPPTHALADFTGSYTNPAYGTMNIYLKNDSLFIGTPTHKLWLRHFNYDIFDVFDQYPGQEIDTSITKRGKMQFAMNLAGAVEGLSSQFEPAVKQILFTKNTIAEPAQPYIWQKYAGEYQSGKLIFKVYISYVQSRETLNIVIPAEGDFELIPVSNQIFLIKTVKNATIQFNTAENGEVTGADYMISNRLFKMKKKRQI